MEKEKEGKLVYRENKEDRRRGRGGKEEAGNKASGRNKRGKGEERIEEERRYLRSRCKEEESI